VEGEGLGGQATVAEEGNLGRRQEGGRRGAHVLQAAVMESYKAVQRAKGHDMCHMQRTAVPGVPAYTTKVQAAACKQTACCPPCCAPRCGCRVLNSQSRRS
jgi:hypothetical protein